MKKSKVEKMKRFFGIILTVMFLLVLFSCSKKVYTNANDKVVPSDHIQKANIDDYCRIRCVYRKPLGELGEIWIDTNTGVLYYIYKSGYAFGITPIMKADGTCLTYTEWKAKNGDRKAN